VTGGNGLGTGTGRHDVILWRAASFDEIRSNEEARTKKE
jgi:hypothetical protein